LYILSKVSLGQVPDTVTGSLLVNTVPSEILVIAGAVLGAGPGTTAYTLLSAVTGSAAANAIDSLAIANGTQVKSNAKANAPYEVCLWCLILPVWCAGSSFLRVIMLMIPSARYCW
jgi:hypothetical protein